MTWVLEFCTLYIWYFNCFKHVIYIIIYMCLCIYVYIYICFGQDDGTQILSNLSSFHITSLVGSHRLGTHID